jgi:hypothetical protein
MGSPSSVEICLAFVIRFAKQYVSASVLQEHRVLVVHLFGNLWYIGNIRDSSPTICLALPDNIQCLPGASIVIRLPNNISSSTVAHGREIKNPRISTRVRQVVTN